MKTLRVGDKVEWDDSRFGVREWPYTIARIDQGWATIEQLKGFPIATVELVKLSRTDRAGIYDTGPGGVVPWPVSDGS